MLIFKYFTAIVMTITLLSIEQVIAQDEANIIVTAERSDRSDYEYYDKEQSAIGLTRKADFFVKSLFITSDSRDREVRKQEVWTMLSALIEQAKSNNITIVAGDYQLKRVTLENMKELRISDGRRPDTSRIFIYARIAVGDGKIGSKEIDSKIDNFVKNIPVTGRSLIETGSIGLVIDNPDQYRAAVVKKIADESKKYASYFGNDYGVEIRGLDSELYFQQASPNEVFLYIEHNFLIKPK